MGPCQALRAFVSCSALMLLGLSTLPGAEPRWEPLWPNGAPGALGKEEADQPALAEFLAPEGKRTATAVVVCPGGGYGMLEIGRAHV